MSYANLQSEFGLDALRRSLEAPSVVRVATGQLKVDDLLGMTDPQATAAFHLIRWPQQKGMPICPKCQHHGVYCLSWRERYKCKSCGTQFSATSGTMLSHRKVPLRTYLLALSVVLEPRQISSLMSFSKEIRLGYKSAHATVQKIRQCVVAQGGCTVPFSLLDRAAWLLGRDIFRRDGGVWKAPPSAASFNYPYLAEEKQNADGADLLQFVNSLVPKGMPDYVRADICQDMIVAILSGQATREQISADHRAFIAKVFADSPWQYKWMSFDAPFGKGDDRRTLHDVLAAPDCEEAA